MSTFVIQLQSSILSETISDIVSFVGEDASGSFGIMAGHERIMTCLEFGLAWFRYQDREIEYLALPGGVLYFVDNSLIINTKHYLRSKNYQEIASALEQKLFEEEQSISDLKDILHNLDKGILKHLREMKLAEMI
jgi:F-type H+-transporting ATPase subunit epsilon